MTFADQIQAIADRPGWTQKRIAAEIGVSQGVVSRWMRGVVLPGRDNEQKIYDLGRALGDDTGPSTLERLGALTQRTNSRATDFTNLICFEWRGRLSPAAAAKVASIIADDMADRAFRWQPVEAAS